MNKRPINLDKATTGTFNAGRSFAVRGLWYLVENAVIHNPWLTSSVLRVWVLRLFGAKVGQRVTIRPRVRVKHPWRLVVGDHCWIGEGAHLHNQDWLVIGANSVISQDAFVTTGTHDSYRTMDLITRPVQIGEGCWVTSRALVMAGTTVGDGTIITPNSVVKGTLEPWSIYSGNPGVRVGERRLDLGSGASSE